MISSIKTFVIEGVLFHQAVVFIGMKVSQLRSFIRNEVRRTMSESSSSVDAIIDALPVLNDEFGFGQNIDPNDVVDIESVFKQKVKIRIYGLRRSDLKMVVKTSIPADDIIPVQAHLFRDGLKRYVSEPPKELPLVILDGGSYFAQDHTRIAAQILKGKNMIDVRLLEHVGRGVYRRP